MSIRNENFSSFRQIDDGLNQSLDPQDIANTEVVDANNMIFRNGYPESRPGSKLKWAKPNGETNNLLNLFRTRDSLGNNYAVAVYAPNFYVRDDVNSQWIQINHTYNPSATYKSFAYGYVNWNAGKSADVLYVGNGQEDCIKWPIVMRYLTVAALSTDSSITVDDGSYFPATGSIILQSTGGSPVYATYTSVTGNVVTLSAPIGTAVASGAGVTFQILDLPSPTGNADTDSTHFPKGNIIAKSDGRLLVAGRPKFETRVYGSVKDSPEDMSHDGTATGGFFEDIPDGSGGLTSLVDFGEYILATKTDSAYKLDLQTQSASDLSATSLTVNKTPVFSDASLGPITNAASIKKNNDLLFATLTEGLFSLTPGNTGTITSVEPTMISTDIYRLYHGLNFSTAKAVSWNQFVFWSCASNVVSDTVLVLDLLKSNKKGKYVWTRFDNWGVQDWLVYRDSGGELLYFGNRIDGNIYQTFPTDYVDMEQSTGQTPYQCSFLTKRFDYGFSPVQLHAPENSRAMISYFSHPDKLKVADKLHVQGYITTTGTLYIDIYYNENGKFYSITKQISGTENLIYQNLSPALAMMMLGLPIMGGTTIGDFDSLGLINMYIPLPIGVGFSNIQFKFYTTDPGIHWGITGFAYNGIMMDAIPSGLVQQDTDTIAANNTTLPQTVNTIVIPTKSWVFDYVPTGTVNGVNTSFITPAASQVVVWADGELVKGSGVDYSFSSPNISFTAGRQPYSSISVSYLPL